MDNIEQARQPLHSLKPDATIEEARRQFAEMLRVVVVQVMTRTKGQSLRSSRSNRGDGAQRYIDAAERDREAGHLTDSMADWYDNEVSACYRD
jgi:hypothetical protein